MKVRMAVFVPKVILDTNVLISAALTPGNARTIVTWASKRQVLVYTSLDLTDELARVLGKKIGFETLKVQAIMRSFYKTIYRTVYPEERLDVIADDPTDNRVLEAALAADANYIISGDKHLLNLGKYRSIKIMAPGDFVQLF